MGGSLLRRKWHHLTFHAELSSRNKSPQKLILDLQKHWTIHSGSNDSKRNPCYSVADQGDIFGDFPNTVPQVLWRTFVDGANTTRSLERNLLQSFKNVCFAMKCNLPRDQEFAREKQNESLPILKTLCLYQLLFGSNTLLWWKYIHTLSFLRPSSSKDLWPWER